MSEHLQKAEEAILAHLSDGRSEFIGKLVEELQSAALDESSLRAAVWILAGEGRIKVDRNMNATSVLVVAA